MNSLSTHILDTGAGRPAAGVSVILERLESERWIEVGEGATGVDGRFDGFGAGLRSGSYRLRFDTGSFGNTFYPEVIVRFEIDGDDEHFHIPLLLSPYGYTTYRGS